MAPVQMVVQHTPSHIQHVSARSTIILCFHRLQWGQAERLVMVSYLCPVPIRTRLFRSKMQCSLVLPHQVVRGLGTTSPYRQTVGGHRNAILQIVLQQNPRVRQATSKPRTSESHYGLRMAHAQEEGVNASLEHVHRSCARFFCYEERRPSNRFSQTASLIITTRTNRSTAIKNGGF